MQIILFDMNEKFYLFREWYYFRKIKICNLFLSFIIHAIVMKNFLIIVSITYTNKQFYLSIIQSPSYKITEIVSLQSQHFLV